MISTWTQEASSVFVYKLVCYVSVYIKTNRYLYDTASIILHLPILGKWDQWEKYHEKKLCLMYL